VLENGHTINVLDHGFVRLIDSMGTDQRVVEAARISYRSPSKGEDADRKLLRYLLINKHTSPFEMCKITFNVKMPIFVMRQWVRHRMQNLNEVSARYTELADEFYMPSAWRKQDEKNKQGSVATEEIDDKATSGILSKFYQEAYAVYQSLLTRGVAREMARIVLPVGVYTECYSCWDLNNLLKFFSLRDDAHAQAEIQEYARAMKEITRGLFPWVIDLYDELRQTLTKKPGV
jgi:thymidylate synthase (FAD)